jgi:drug/metabolite transporter (DMT)-like permease
MTIKSSRFGSGLGLSVHSKGFLLATGGIAVISFDGLLVRLQGLTPSAMVFWRGVLTAIGFAFLAWLAYRRKTFASFKTIDAGVVGVAIFTALGNAMFVVAVTHTTVADTLVILASAPLLTAVLGRVLLGERLHLRTWLAGTAVFIGVLGIFGSGLGHGGILGDLAALGGSLSLALLLITLRKFQDMRQFSALCFGGVITAVVSAPFIGDFSVSPTQAGFALLDGAIILPIGLGMVSMAPRYIAASEVSLITLLEMVLGPLWVWWALSEEPTLATYLSAALVLSALSIHSYLDLRAERVSGLPDADAGAVRNVDDSVS